MKRETTLDYLEAIADRTPEDLDLPAYDFDDEPTLPRVALSAREPVTEWPVALCFDDPSTP